MAQKREKAQKQKTKVSGTRKSINIDSKRVKHHNVNNTSSKRVKSNDDKSVKNHKSTNFKKVKTTKHNSAKNTNSKGINSSDYKSVKNHKSIKSNKKINSNHKKNIKKNSEEVTVDEFFMPSPVHIGKYKIPLGIRFLMGYLSFVSVLYIFSFISSIAFPTTILFGQLVTGSRAVVVNVFLLVLVLSVIYGLWKRKAFAFDLSIGFFMFSTLNSLLSITLFEWGNHPFKKLMLLSFASLVLVNIVIIWYILKEKKYFFIKQFRDKNVMHTDRLFLYTVITFWVMALLLGSTLGLQYYNQTTEKIDSTLAEINGEYVYNGPAVCASKEGEDRDICLLVLTQAYQQENYAKEKIIPFCDKIESDFYRFVCLKSVK